MFEAVRGVQASGDQIVDFSGFAGYSQVTTQGEGGKESVEQLRFYEYDSATLRTNAWAWEQNAPAFANVTYRYGCYNGNDVYFFYTYADHTLTYRENNDDLTTANVNEAKTKTVDFHYVDGQPVADLIEGEADYTPDRPFVSAYGNKYTFAGWYTANLTEDATDNERFRVDWDTFAPVSDVSIYAAWAAPTFTLTLIVPGGELYQDSLEQFEQKGYDWSVSRRVDAAGMVTNTYLVTGIPDGTPSDMIVARRRGASSQYSLAFDHWSYRVNGADQQYLFDESQSITGDLTLTARWKTEYTGSYTVRYLTQNNPGTNLGKVELAGEDGTPVTWYRLLEDKAVSGVAVGSLVTEEARAVKNYLSAQGEQSRMVDAQGGVTIDFLYAPISSEVRYTVHYVRDEGADYGREAPPAGLVRLAPDKTVTVDEAALQGSTTISEPAVVVGGYTPRDSWNHSFTLSASEEQNHLYIYYVSNTYEVDFSVTYHFMRDDGTYAAPGGGEGIYTFLLNARDALGKVIHAADLVENYSRYLQGEEDQEQLARLEQKMRGHTLDTAMTSPLSILLRQAASADEGQTVNVIDIYLKNGDYDITYVLNDGGDPSFPASWKQRDDFLVPGPRDKSFVQTVRYPGAATPPTSAPARLSYAFAGWNTLPDGSGDGWTADTLPSAPWYKERGMAEPVTLYAQWEKKPAVKFELRGGSWTDDGTGRFHQTADGWYGYADGSDLAPRPADPTRVENGAAYSFIGWTATDPETLPDALYGPDNRIDLVTFEQYRFDFSTPITGVTVLYAVWDPDVTDLRLDKTDTDGHELEGAVFILERLLATVSGDGAGGYIYTPVPGGDGGYQTDASFAPRTLTTGAAGTLAFESLPAGWYRLTEDAAPAGYGGLAAQIVIEAPYGGEPRLVKPADHPYVSGQAQEGDLLLTVRNIPRYSVTINAPDSLTIQYTAPELIWNPEALAYEAVAGQQPQWTVPETPVTVTNTATAPGAAVEVSVALAYDQGYAALLPLSTLKGPASGFTGEDTADEKRLTGILNVQQQASFTLGMGGVVRPDLVPPGQTVEVGAITVAVRRPGG